MPEPDTHTMEEKISSWLDEEMSASQRESFERALTDDPALKQMADDHHRCSELFALYRAEPPVDVPFEKLYDGISRQVFDRGQVKQGEQPVNPTELVRTILEAQRPGIWERLFGGLVPALVGAAAALAVVFVMTGRSPERAHNSTESMASKGTDGQNLPIGPGMKRDLPKPTISVSTKPEVKPGNVLPNLEVASIVTQADSCIIESMNAEDETVTTVFKIADSDGSMITVIWFPVEDEGTSI